MTRRDVYQYYQGTSSDHLLPDYDMVGSDLEILDPARALPALFDRVDAMRRRAESGMLTRRDPDYMSLERDAVSVRDLLRGYLDQLGEEHPKYTKAAMDWAAAEVARRQAGDSSLELIDILTAMHDELIYDGEDGPLIQIVETWRQEEAAAVCAVDAHELARLAA